MNGRIHHRRRGLLQEKHSTKRRRTTKGRFFNAVDKHIKVWESKLAWLAQGNSSESFTPEVLPGEPVHHQPMRLCGSEAGAATTLTGKLSTAKTIVMQKYDNPAPNSSITELQSSNKQFWALRYRLHLPTPGGYANQCNMVGVPP